MKLRFASGFMSMRERLRSRIDGEPQTPEPVPEGKAALALARQRGRGTIPAAPRAGKAAAAIVRPLLPQTGLGLAELKRRWAEIVGPPFADKTAPEKFAAGVLTLRAPGALAPFLQQQIPLLTERLRLAGAAVKQIRIEQRSVAPPKSNLRKVSAGLTPVEEAALSQSLDQIADAGLKAALLRLGRAVKQG